MCVHCTTSTVTVMGCTLHNLRLPGYSYFACNSPIIIMGIYCNMVAQAIELPSIVHNDNFIYIPATCDDGFSAVCVVVLGCEVLVGAIVAASVTGNV